MLTDGCGDAAERLGERQVSGTPAGGDKEIGEKDKKGLRRTESNKGYGVTKWIRESDSDESKGTKRKVRKFDTDRQVK